MGVELLCTVLEADKNVQLNWQLGKVLIKNLSDLDVLNIYSEAMHLGEEYLQEDLSDPEILNLVKVYREYMFEALNQCCLGWNHRHPFIMRLELKNNNILIAAGESFGDNIPQCDYINLFQYCGASKAVGFYE